MNIAVRYYTRGGNTKKLAKAIEEAIGVEAKDLSSPLEEKADILFLGCSYYAFDVDAAVKSFIEDNKDNIGEIILFGTSAMIKSMIKPIKKVADPVSVPVSNQEYHCWGEFKMFHKGHPDAADIAGAGAFAKAIADKVQE